VGDDSFLVLLLQVSLVFAGSGPWSARLSVTWVQAAKKSGIKIALHLEPYETRSAETVRLDLEHIHKILLNPVGLNFEKSILMTPCSCNPNNMCPVVFVYDSYRLHPSEWKTLLGNDGGLRCTSNDVFAIALWLDSDGGQQVLSL
jgi:hypothetical protein